MNMNSANTDGFWFSLKSFVSRFFSDAARVGSIGLGSIFVLLIVLRSTSNVKVYVGSKCVRRKRARNADGQLVLELQKEFKKADGQDLTIVFSRALARKLTGQSIMILDQGKVAAQFVAPEFSGTALAIEVETPGV